MKKNRGFIAAMTSPALLILLILSVFPLIYTLKNSLTDYYLLDQKAAKFVGIANYIGVLKDHAFRQALLNTLLFTILGVIIETILGLMIAVFVDSFKKGKEVIRTLLLLPMLLPPVTVALIWQIMFSNHGGIINQLLNYCHLAQVNWLADVHTAFGCLLVIDIWQYTPLTFLLIYASLQGVSKNQFEAAAIDGANFWNQFIHIILPNIQDGLMMVILLRTIDTFRLFDKVNILTKGGPANSTATITQYIYQYGTKNFKIGYASSATVIMTIIVLFMASIYLKKSLQESKIET